MHLIADGPQLPDVHRTIEGLRGNGPLVAVGVAYAAQQVDAVPHSGRDQRLDWVVTEDGAVRVG